MRNGSIYRISPLPSRLATRSTDPHHGPHHAVYRAKRETDLYLEKVANLHRDDPKGNAVDGQSASEENNKEDDATLAQLREKMAKLQPKNQCAVNVAEECRDGEDGHFPHFFRFYGVL